MALKYGCDFKTNNPHRVVWKLNCKDVASLQTSMKDLCTSLGIKLEKDEDKTIIESIQILGKEIVDTLKQGDVTIKNLLILDDVTRETCQCLQDFIRECTTNPSSINLIATTFYPIFSDSEILEITGFTEEEALEFLSEDKSPSEKDKIEYIKLAKSFSFLPLGLYCARTYMRHTHTTPGKFNKLCATPVLRQIEENRCITDDSEAVLNNKTLFKGLLQFIGILQKNENSKVFDMILSLQFLEIDEIPVLLFDFLSSDTDYANQAMETNNFIQAMQTFSFGKIEGEDDNRFLCTHLAVIRALKIFTDQSLPPAPDTDVGSVTHKHAPQRSSNLLKQLLKAFMYVMDKDNRSYVDLSRNKIVVHHAKSVLHHADKLASKDLSWRSDIEFLLSLVYVHDLVGYTYNFDNVLNLAADHSNKAKEYVFVILKLDESEFGNELEAECRKIENVAQLDTYCKEKAMTIFEAMKRVVNENSEILKRVAQRFILNKHRVEDDILALSEILKNDLEREKQLNDDEYEALSKLKYAVPLEDMKYLFLYELVFSTLYTHGRRLFYLIEPVNRIRARIFCGYLYISHHISRLTNGQFPKWKCLYSMLTERSGTLQQCIEDRPALQQHNMATFQKVADRCETMLQEDTRYYVFGVYKMDTKQDEHNQAIWLKQLIRCYRNMLGCAVDQSEKEDVTNKGRACVIRLQESLPSIENRTPFVSIQFSIGEFYDCIGDKNSAEKIFESLTPDVLLSQHKDLTKDKLRKYEKKASILLIKCLCENNKMDMARQLFQRVKLKFQLSHDITELKIFEQIQKDYQLS